ncbi:PEP-CTERM sorting domain-containing protein [Parvularcula sp. IMCC14364]|uniref:PEP-CTERM sorting domain-containing protein n=1 Tax=Parvularcula sp. IMCC14364 TaxID=3067902 RepID=UPI0027407566|nr:PEP-CTERM sorting domain-containing protein [Parvularcula sp. IMCC14364]
MRKSFIIVGLAVLSGLMAMPAHAETVIYNTSELASANGRPVDNPGFSLGAADGNSATLAPFGWIAYQTDALFNAFDITVELSGLTGSTTLAIFAGTTNGSGGFSQLRTTFFEAVNGANNIVSQRLSDFCVSIGGCDTFIVYNFESGQSIQVDSVDLTANMVAATPEPGTWAMMLIGFAFIAWQLKVAKRRNAGRRRTSPTISQPAFA